MEHNKEMTAIRREMQHRFMMTGEIDPRVPEYIANSWRRSRAFGIDIKTGGIGRPATEKKRLTLLERNKNLIQIARPIMESIYQTLDNVSAIVVLFDVEGHILEIVGSDNVKQRHAMINYCVGTKWSEDEVGTSGFAVCLAENRPIRVLAEQMYCECHHNATCAAAPIHNESGKVIGALELSNQMIYFSNYSLGLATAGAKLIEKHIHLLNSNQLLTDAFNTIQEGVIIVDENYRISFINKNGQQILELPEPEIAGQDIRALLKDLDYKSVKADNCKQKRFSFLLPTRQVHCIGQIFQPDFDGQNMRGVIVFQPEKTVNNLVNEMTGHRAHYTFSDIVTNSSAVKNLLATGQKMASTNCNILITGESGTGKELFAHAIHNASDRATKPFIAINCAAIPRDLVESEIFGYEEGSFTGAKRHGRPGKFELADGGTIFLDEAGEFPMDLQSKLLRFLDNHKVARIGGNCEKEVDVRIIAATNRDLKQEVERNNFRLDLYYRLNVMTLTVPPLRERPEDIPILARHFFHKLNSENEKKLQSIDADVLTCLQNYSWEGNIRQLQNVITRAYYLCEEDNISLENLPAEISHTALAGSCPVSASPLVELEKEVLIKAISARYGNITEVAKDLNVSKPTIYRKMQKYDIDVKKVLMGTK